MKVFVSSLISGMEPIRRAARDSVASLGHQPVMAEDFGARAQSPQVACLDGLRQSDVVVLVLGDRYGAVQPSGLSATHEEYREARGRKPVLAFVQEGVAREPAQAEFVNEMQGWEGGLFRAGFADAADLSPKVVRALHEWQLANAAGPLDPGEMLARALDLLPPEQQGVHGQGTWLDLAVSGGPAQPVLRPAEMDDPGLADDMLQAALFGAHRVFDAADGSTSRIEGASLILRQGRGARVSIDEGGAMAFRLPVLRPSRGQGIQVLVQEDVQRALAGGLSYAGWLLERVDPTQRITHVVPVARVSGAGYLAWRTRAEHEASPNQVQHSMGAEEKLPVRLTPPHRARAALRLDAGRLVEDLVVLLRRQWKR